MARFGYPLMTEQNGPNDPVRYAVETGKRTGGNTRPRFLHEAAEPLPAALRAAAA